LDDEDWLSVHPDIVHRAAHYLKWHAKREAEIEAGAAAEWVRSEVIVGSEWSCKTALYRLAHATVTEVDLEGGAVKLVVTKSRWLTKAEAPRQSSHNTSVDFLRGWRRGPAPLQTRLAREKERKDMGRLLRLNKGCILSCAIGGEAHLLSVDEINGIPIDDTIDLFKVAKINDPV
jgi:hypothetical protein